MMHLLRKFRSTRRLLAVLCLLPLLSSCYVPDQFRAEIRIARNGDYSMTYDGVLTWVQLYMDLRSGKLSGKAAQDKIEIIRRDLARDTQFTNIRSLGNGQFAVTYKRTGNLATRAGLITFIRRNARILEIDSRPDGKVTVKANTPNMDKARPLAEAGLLIRGSLRVMSELRLMGQHNATAVYKDPNTDWIVYDWIIDGTKPVYPLIQFRR